ncbi:MAG: hypothetical protein EXX96DRAFT_565308 [Benjaminiella poitrasii]|nr:MAG: hypothetical protein EXX96DRAFT_565308 [Benjaminiella poitrasii]
MIAYTSLKTIWKRTASGKISVYPYPLNKKQQLRYSSSSYNDNNKNKENKKQQETVAKSNTQKKNCAPDIPSFMPVINIPVTELAHSAFYSLHRPLLGLPIPKPFLAGNMVGHIEREDNDCSEEAFIQYMTNLRPFEPPGLNTRNMEEEKSSTTTLTVEVDPSYFLNHNNNHDEIADYLTAMQEKLDILYDERAKKLYSPSSKKKLRRLRKRKGFFEKN